MGPSRDATTTRDITARVDMIGTGCIEHLAYEFPMHATGQGDASLPCRFDVWSMRLDVPRHQTPILIDGISMGVCRRERGGSGDVSPSRVRSSPVVYLENHGSSG